MFNTAETVIDTIQTAKKQAVKTFVKHEAIAESLVNWIDTETSIAKDAVKVSTETATSIGKEVVKAAQDASKADYLKEAAEFYTSFWKSAFESTKNKAK
jgi:hypothetical protein